MLCNCEDIERLGSNFNLLCRDISNFNKKCWTLIKECAKIGT